MNRRLPATAPYWLRVLCQEVFRDSHIIAQVPEHHLGLELLGGGWDLGPKKDSSWSMVLSNTEIFWSVMVQIHASSIYS